MGMKGLIVPAAFLVISLCAHGGALAQGGASTQPAGGGSGTSLPTQTKAQQQGGSGGSKFQSQTFGATATVLLQCRRRADPKGNHDFVVAASDRSGAALSVTPGDSCAEALRELLDQGLLIAAVTEFNVNTALYTLVRPAP
jgi:hypothetical protein